MNIIQELKRLLSIPTTPETFKRKVSELVVKYDTDAEAVQEQAKPAETPVVEEATVGLDAPEEVKEVEESQAE